MGWIKVTRGVCEKHDRRSTMETIPQTLPNLSKASKYVDFAASERHRRTAAQDTSLQRLSDGVALAGNALSAEWVVGGTHAYAFCPRVERRHTVSIATGKARGASPRTKPD